MSSQQRLVKSAGLRFIAPASVTKPKSTRAISSLQSPSQRPQQFACRSKAVKSDFHRELPLPDTRSACAPTLFIIGAANSTTTLSSSPLRIAFGDSGNHCSSTSQLSRPFSTQCRIRPTVSKFSPSSLSSSIPRRNFSRTYPAMVAQRLDGNAIAKTIRERLATEIAEKQKINPRYKPCLKIIQGMHVNCKLRLTA